MDVGGDVEVAGGGLSAFKQQREMHRKMHGFNGYLKKS